MLSDQTIDILKAFFIATADHELSIEKQRQYLARLGGPEGKGISNLFLNRIYPFWWGIWAICYFCSLR